MLINQGAGIFATKVDYGTGATPRSVSSADVNGDGKPDLLVANQGANTVSVLTNRGDGTLAAKLDYAMAAGSDPLSVSSADVNGDGKPDLLVANTGTAKVSVFLNTSLSPIAFTEGANVASTPVLVDAGLLLSDVDNSTLASATVSITGNFQTAQDVLAFANDGSTMGNVAASYDAATGVLTLSSAGASATLTEWQTALRAVTYTNTSDAPDTGTITVVDDVAPSLKAADSTPADDAPDGAVSASPQLVFSENIAFGTGNITLYNVTDSTTVETFDVTTAQGSGDGKVSISGATLTINPTAALGLNKQYAIQIDATALKDSANNAFAGIADNTSYNFTTASNQPPTLSSAPSDLSVTEDTASNLDLSAVNFADGEGNSLTVTLAVSAGTLAASSGGGVTVGDSGTASMTLAGSAENINTFLDTVSNIQYTSASNANGDNAATLTITPNDGSSNGTPATVNLDITAVNDAPTLSATASSPTFTEDGSAVALFSGATASTVESGQRFSSLTLTVSNVTDSTEYLQINGIVVALSETTSGLSLVTLGGESAGSVTVNGVGSTKTVTLSAMALSAANLQTLINGITYSNNSQSPTTSNTRVVTLTAITDNGGHASGGFDSTTLAISSTVTLSAVNDAPEITSNSGGATATVNVAENTTAVTTVVATDADADAVTYAITGGADQAAFTINATTGVLRFASAPNFEAPTDTGDTAGNNTYVVEVTASDGQGGTDVQTLTISVTDVAEGGGEPPPPPQDDDGVDAEEEDSIPGIPPKDGGPAVAGDGNGDGIKDSEQPQVTSLNFRQTSSISNQPGAPKTPVTLVVGSQDGQVGSNAGNVQITSISQKDAPANLPEGFNAPLGLLSFTAKVDTGATETFSFYLDGALGINGYFKQNASGAWVNLADPANGGRVVNENGKTRLDFVIEDGGQFDSDGRADGTITDPGAPGTLALPPKPGNTAPVITSGSTASVAENAPTSTVIYQASATDADAGQSLTYSLSGADAALLSIHSSTGAVTLKASANYEAQASYRFKATLNKSLARHASLPWAVCGVANPRHGTCHGCGLRLASHPNAGRAPSRGLIQRRLNVIATDNATVPLSATKAVTVSVTDVNEAPSAVALTGTTTSLAENTNTSTRIAVGTLAITDDALGTNSVTLSGADANSFEFDGSKLYLQAGTVLDFETQTSYAVTISVADSTVAGSSPVRADFTLRVTDVNEEVPPQDDSDGDQFPDALEAAHGLSVGVKDNDVFGSTKLYAMQLYRDTLFREAEETGLTHWREILDSGTQSRAEVANAFLNSHEFQIHAGALARLYFAAFDRIPDEAGITHWMEQMLNQGQSLEQVAEGFTNSTEFQNQYGPLDNGDFLETLYQNVLGRLPDEAGKAHWLGQLGGGITRGEVLAGFSQSGEYQELMHKEVNVTLLYVGLLGRTPEQTGYEHWLNVLNSQGDVLGTIDAFVQSQEYHDRFLPDDGETAGLVGLVGLAPAPLPDVLG